MGKELLRFDDAPKKMYTYVCLWVSYTGCRKNIKFGIAGANEISEIAEVEVCSRELYNVANREPVAHGCLDRRLVPYHLGRPSILIFSPPRASLTRAAPATLVVASWPSAPGTLVTSN